MNYFSFNEAKTTQAASLLLHMRGGKMSYMKLIKLLYLADREALRRWEYPITGDYYVSMKHGPVLGNVYDKITYGDNPKDEPSYWSRFIAPPQGYDVSTLSPSPPPDGELSQRETDLLRETFEQFGKLSRWQLVDHCHTLPEWDEIGGGATPVSAGLKVSHSGGVKVSHPAS